MLKNCWDTTKKLKCSDMSIYPVTQTLTLFGFHNGTDGSPHIPISIFSMIIYALSSILLDNHHVNIEHVKTQISSFRNGDFVVRYPSRTISF